MFENKNTVLGSFAQPTLTRGDAAIVTELKMGMGPIRKPMGYFPFNEDILTLTVSENTFAPIKLRWSESANKESAIGKFE